MRGEGLTKESQLVSIAESENWGCVAIVDDDEDSTLVLQEFLETKGLSAERFSMAEALLDADPNRFTAILLDLNLPGMWGSECGFELRRRGYIGPIIAISGNIEIWDSGDIHYLGFTDKMSKPIQPKELIEVLRKYLMRSEDVPAKPDGPEEWTEQRPDPDAVVISAIARPAV